ncbi:3-dehydroquinate synthase [Denitratisoma sp. agr-D3]
MSEIMEIQSHKGPYRVFFLPGLLDTPGPITQGDCHFLVDARVEALYHHQLLPVLMPQRTILIEAVEESKSLQNIIPVIERLVAAKVRRGQVLVAIGGGIIQDICCFIASTLLRGIEWRFVPTTLLSQADSCIGSKSSINLGDAKNILGTFNPPAQILVEPAFLDSLDEREIRSGIGEILKVHAIAGPQDFDMLARDFPQLFSDRMVLLHYIRRALQIKQRYIEQDEFDRGIRNIFNYGHSFGHAIESATYYGIPHGIAVAMGMDMANFISARRGLLPQAHYRRMHPTLHSNYAPFAATPIPLESLLAALQKDKKNTATQLGLVFPLGEDAAVSRVQMESDPQFAEDCRVFLEGLAHEYH